MKAERKKILERLKRLMSMTEENGASEMEAMTAAEKASELMAEYNLTYDSVKELESETYSVNSKPWFRGSYGLGRSGNVPVTRWCVPAIAKLLNCKVVYDSVTGTLTFFGMPHDTEVAHYLEQVIRNAIKREWELFKKKRGHGRGRTSFQYVMAYRIANRLLRMDWQRRGQSDGSNALVVAKDKMVADRFKKVFTNIRKASYSPDIDDTEAAEAGADAGNRVELNQGIENADGNARIGREV